MRLYVQTQTGCFLCSFASTPASNLTSYVRMSATSWRQMDATALEVRVLHVAPAQARIALLGQ